VVEERKMWVCKTLGKFGFYQSKEQKIGYAAAHSAHLSP